MHFTTFTGNHLCWSLKAWNFSKKRLQRRCFPVKFARFLRTPILKNICKRLLLCCHFLFSMVCRYVGIHHFHYACTCVINDVTFSGMQWMISWWVNNLVYLFFEQTFVWVYLNALFVSLTFLQIPMNKLFQWSLLLYLFSSASYCFVF